MKKLTMPWGDIINVTSSPRIYKIPTPLKSQKSNPRQLINWIRLSKIKTIPNMKLDIYFPFTTSCQKKNEESERK